MLSGIDRSHLCLLMSGGGRMGLEIGAGAIARRMAIS
jgi:hypothetical protein